ncbi:metallophosphoesterase [Roseomonas gilardii]|uniref:metallophosphoesterase n=1 Tax=Roseomonas gilardii TaxID=257708 RepID=UPI0031F4F445
MTDIRSQFEGLRVIGDVHGDAAAYVAAVEGARAERLFIIQLGDLTDGGPDAPEVLRQTFALLDARAGLFLLGNHDHKLRRALSGARLHIDANGLGNTLQQIEQAPDRNILRDRIMTEVARAPAWLRIDQRVFVHAGFHPRMLHLPLPRGRGQPPRGAGAARPVRPGDQPHAPGRLPGTAA